MADFQVGSKGGKDRYMVGWNGDSKSGYKVGGGGAGVGQASKSLPGDQDAVVGGKSAFNYKEPDVKDPGDKSDNSNFGGSNSMSRASDPTGPGGQVQLTYSEKGDWSAQKDAMSRRKAQADNAKYYSTSQFKSPTVDLVNIKK